jgi:hypothetical protein
MEQFPRGSFERPKRNEAHSLIKHSTLVPVSLENLRSGRNLAGGLGGRAIRIVMVLKGAMQGEYTVAANKKGR